MQGVNLTAPMVLFETILMGQLLENNSVLMAMLKFNFSHMISNNSKYKWRSTLTKGVCFQ